MSKSVAAVQTVQDPVCGMSVSPDSAAGSFEYKGQTYYFCSNHCRQKFQDAPERYIAPKWVASSAAEEKTQEPLPTSRD